MLGENNYFLPLVEGNQYWMGLEAHPEREDENGKKIPSGWPYYEQDTKYTLGFHPTIFGGFTVTFGHAAIVIVHAAIVMFVFY